MSTPTPESIMEAIIPKESVDGVIILLAAGGAMLVTYQIAHALFDIARNRIGGVGPSQELPEGDSSKSNGLD